MKKPVKNVMFNSIKRYLFEVKVRIMKMNIIFFLNLQEMYDSIS